MRTMVVGLGNPGNEYRDTRHNIGFRVLDSIAMNRRLRWRRLGWIQPLAWVGEDERVILVKPRTYMNRSGLAAAVVCRKHGIAAGDVVAVYDDADLELGRLKLKKSGGTGGHNGVRSLTAELGTDEFPRVRVGVRGVGRDGADLAGYLLSPFEDGEIDRVERSVSDAAKAVGSILGDGIEVAMNRYNSRGGTAAESSF